MGRAADGIFATTIRVLRAIAGDCCAADTIGFRADIITFCFCRDTCRARFLLFRNELDIYAHQFFLPHHAPPAGKMPPFMPLLKCHSRFLLSVSI